MNTCQATMTAQRTRDTHSGREHRGGEIRAYGTVRLMSFTAIIPDRRSTTAATRLLRLHLC
jgi:hypothetical protein